MTRTECCTSSTGWLQTLLIFVWLIPLSLTHATALLIKGKTAEIKVKVVYVKAGAGNAFIDRGRLYQGDMVTILSKENLSSWVQIQSGRVTGYVPLKVLRFDTQDASQVTDPNLLRRLEDYEYDSQGRRVKRTGERAGSGEQRGERETSKATSHANQRSPITMRFSLGVGRFERSFSSNAPIQSILSKAAAEPLVLTTLAELNYNVTAQYLFTARFLDYRLGLTQLQTPVLNEGLAFDIKNEGQLFELVGMIQWNRTNVSASGGPILSIQRHQFQPTEPVPIFLSSLSTSIGIQTVLTASIPGADISLIAAYASTIDSSQNPETSGNLQSGRLWSLRTLINVSISDQFAGTLEGLVSHEEIERAGVVSHIDSITDPNNELLYTASKDINLLSAVLVGMRWTP
jgi:hypothetical protein